MVSLVKASQQKDYPAHISLVISNIPDAPGLEKARDLGIMTMTVSHKDFPNREKFEAALDAVLKQADIELICCAGFMRVLTPWFVKQWDRRILNIHPSLLPKYKGLNTHQRALDAGNSVTQLSAEATAAFDAPFAATVARWVDEANTIGIDAEALLAKARAAIAANTE